MFTIERTAGARPVPPRRVADVAAERAYDKTIPLSGSGLGCDDIQVKRGKCSLVLHTETLTAALRKTANAPEPPEDTIEPMITAKAPDPLFTTADTFADASRKLIDRKRLLDTDDEGAP
jgi:hypothetical protein